MARLLAILAAGVAGVLGDVGAFTGSATAADAARGQAVFGSQCSICHSNTRNGGVVVGPPLYGVVGRKAGSIPDFSYSSTMKAAGFVWTADQLRAYLPAPRRYLPNVKMTYPGLKNPTQLNDLIAYLETLK
ncbi:MAG: Cytochrome c2 [Phenylobacterium sp.]|uniref:c-type cytochrome n=1 Tax=Phenylobacterium sp. TaxID=1871053 RepID=UPI00262FA8BE|nr:c-type cytochrome [Phenylobacterium sp.]MDB5495996.1 Cytochrome c2 [Phenylobacterium sp.]